MCIYIYIYVGHVKVAAALVFSPVCLGRWKKRVEGKVFKRLMIWEAYDFASPFMIEGHFLVSSCCKFSNKHQLYLLCRLGFCTDYASGSLLGPHYTWDKTYLKILLDLVFEMLFLFLSCSSLNGLCYKSFHDSFGRKRG